MLILISSFLHPTDVELVNPNCCVLSEFTCCFKTCWTCLFTALKCSKGEEWVTAKKQLRLVWRARVHRECLWFQTCDTGPFSDIRLLEKKPAHMAVLLHYLISNSDPCALVRSSADCLLHCSCPLLSVCSSADCFIHCSCPLLSVCSSADCFIHCSCPLLSVCSSADCFIHCSCPLLSVSVSVSVSCFPLLSVSSTVPFPDCLCLFFCCSCPLLSVSASCVLLLSLLHCSFLPLSVSVPCVSLLSVCSSVPFPVLSLSFHPSSCCCLPISVAICLSCVFPCVFSSFYQPFSIICPSLCSPAFCFLFGLCFCLPGFLLLHNLSCVILFLCSLSLCSSVHLPLSSVAVHLCCSVSLSKSSVLCFSFSTLWRIPTSSQQATQKIYANGDTRFSPPSLLVLLWVQTCT